MAGILIESAELKNWLETSDLKTGHFVALCAIKAGLKTFQVAINMHDSRVLEELKESGYINIYNDTNKGVETLNYSLTKEGRAIFKMDASDINPDALEVLLHLSDTLTNNGLNVGFRINATNAKHVLTGLNLKQDPLTVEDFKLINTYFVAKWKDEDFNGTPARNYLNPTSLYRKNKLEAKLTAAKSGKGHTVTPSNYKLV